jgi:hypothetical protein
MAAVTDRNDTTGLNLANARRAADAGRAEAARARLILDSPASAGLDDEQRLLLEARAAHPDTPWTKIAGLVGLTKDQAIGRYRRIAERLSSGP